MPEGCHHETAVDRATAAERRRAVGIVLAEVGRQRLAGARRIADVLDAGADAIEHGPPPPQREKHAI